MLDLVIRNSTVEGAGCIDVGIAEGRIAAIAPGLPDAARTLDAAGCLLIPGLVETHIHLDKTCILDRCRIREGTVAEAIHETAAAKRSFTSGDVYARARTTLERCILWGTMAMRTHVEVDPGIGMTGFDAIQQLARDYAWAVDLELCVFPQEGLLNNPGTEALLLEGLRRGARVLGAVPYVDSDPRGQIDRIFAIARDHDVDIDMHLDLAETTDAMQIDYVCRKTEEYGWGGRVAVGHVTQLSLVDRPRFAAIAALLARAGVAVTILPATDLYLMGRSHDHAIPRGVVPAAGLQAAGVTCSISTNNVLNPFTPYGDGSLIRMANLYANVCHVAQPAALATCLHMVTTDSARLMRNRDYGIAVGRPADLVLLDTVVKPGSTTGALPLATRRPSRGDPRPEDHCAPADRWRQARS